MCTDVSFSAPHLLHEGVFALLILCSMYCRLICPVRSPTNILQCFLSTIISTLSLCVVRGWSYQGLLVSPVSVIDSPFSLFHFVHPNFNFVFVTAKEQWQKRFRTYWSCFRPFLCQPVRSFILLNDAFRSLFTHFNVSLFLFRH